jgi:thiol-disulfide isomerase/thioredoxin
MATEAESSEQQDRPLRPRFGRLASIFMGLVVIGLGLNTVFGVENRGGSSAEDTTVITMDPAAFPLGALAGDPAPDVEFMLLEGGTFSVADHVAGDGRPLVLNFWASWCAPCRAEMPEFSELSEEYPVVAFVGVAVDDTEAAARQFADEIGVAYPLGVDADRLVIDTYPYIGLPTTYLIGADGRVVRQIQGQVTKAQLEAFLQHDFGA